MATVHSIQGEHPCFSPGARKRVGRLHLSVAPRATARIRFAGSSVGTQALPPAEALALLDSVFADGTELGIVGITGPGDPMATPESTLETLKLVRAKYPELPLCLTTNGLGAAGHAHALAELGLAHITVLVDAVDPKVAEMIYAWIRPGTRNLCLPDAAELLVSDQLRAIEAFVGAGIPVKVNTTVYRGCNEAHIRDVAHTVADLGASIMAVMPYRALEGSEDYLAVQPGLGIMREVREAAGRYLKLMPQEETCGWDLMGLERPVSEAVGLGPVLPKPSGPRVNVAVASESGMEIDLHLGQAPKFLIYGPREDGLPCLLGTRPAPAPGGGDSRWEELALTLSDCFVLLAAGAGESPRKILGSHGIQVLVTDADAEGAVDVLFGGGEKGKGRGGKR
ncbi:NifB/NifX family molybdenum-iron cluster-binding protein [Desulfovibrio ferrophilus]|uniref:Radical SAM domain protein n=1 Tax=Desulfovibrio ferrophilus TaxID=241368 RepID=A0A2Z6AYE9_9BACT|nr:NifB/NifX family molybdenum-iron cluster-binding protein [Desulfovibrio ferrophilus]BBD08213.1 radical SAM domain protein [Desulfovibrio ferrophilus]